MDEICVPCGKEDCFDIRQIGFDYYCCECRIIEGESNKNPCNSCKIDIEQAKIPKEELWEAIYINLGRKRKNEVILDELSLIKFLNEYKQYLSQSCRKEIKDIVKFDFEELLKRLENE